MSIRIQREIYRTVFIIIITTPKALREYLSLFGSIYRANKHTLSHNFIINYNDVENERLIYL